MASTEPKTALRAQACDEEGGLLRKVAERDLDAFRRLYCLYHRRLHRFLTRFTRERALAEEVINDTMLVVWESAADFRGEAQASTWILGIAYRRALKAIERNRPARRESHALAATALIEPAELDTLARSAELGDWVESALRQLSAEQRMVIELAYFFGLSIDEIADVAACPPGTVKTRMFYGRERLRTILLDIAGPRVSPSPEVAR